MTPALGLIHLAHVARHPFAYRAHQRAVRIQNRHLDRTLHGSAGDPADPTCDYCVARSADLAFLAAAGAVFADDPRLLPVDRPDFCTGARPCPDREACTTGAPCALVYRVEDRVTDHIPGMDATNGAR